MKENDFLLRHYLSGKRLNELKKISVQFLTLKASMMNDSPNLIVNGWDLPSLNKVLAEKKFIFSNRLKLPKYCAHKIPDSMSRYRSRD